VGARQVRRIIVTQLFSRHGHKPTRIPKSDHNVNCTTLPTSVVASALCAAVIPGPAQAGSAPGELTPNGRSSPKLPSRQARRELQYLGATDDVGAVVQPSARQAHYLRQLVITAKGRQHRVVWEVQGMGESRHAHPVEPWPADSGAGSLLSSDTSQHVPPIAGPSQNQSANRSLLSLHHSRRLLRSQRSPNQTWFATRVDAANEALTRGLSSFRLPGNRGDVIRTCRLKIASSIMLGESPRARVSKLLCR